MKQQRQRLRGERQSLGIISPADRKVTRPSGGERGNLEAACILLGLGTSRSCNVWVHPELRARQGGQGQLGPGPWGAASVVEASRGRCLDPLTCLGPQRSSQSPQGEGRRTWSPPPQHWPRPMQTRPPTRQEDTVEPGLGRHSRRRAPQGPAGRSDVSSHWARPRCPLVPSALASQTTGSKNTQSGLLAPLWGPLDLEGPSRSGQLPPPFRSPRCLLTPAGGVCPQSENHPQRSPGLACLLAP